MVEVIGYITQSELYSNIQKSNGNDLIATNLDNIVIPQNDIPQLTAKVDAIPLIARARRIAVNSNAA